MDQATTPYEAPAIEERALVELPLIGVGSPAPS
jgi:hypothetical protein